MTVPVPTNLVFSYQGDGATTVFSYPVRFLDQGEIVVTSRVGNVDTIKILDVDYTVSGAGTPGGGSITTTYVPGSDETIILYRATEAKQIVDLQDRAKNPAEAVEVQLDRMVMVAQDQDRRIGDFEGSLGDLDEAVGAAEDAADRAGSGAQTAEDAADRAEAAAASVNLPSITEEDAGKTLQVKSDGSGYEVGVEPQEQSAKLQVISDATAADYRKTAAIMKDGSSNPVLQLLTRPFYNPYDYGALGLSNSDDTNALQACLADAKANAGIQSSPKGRGTIVIPPGFLRHTGFELDVPGLKLVGLGGWLEAINSADPALKVTAGGCTVQDVILVKQGRPSAAVGCLEHVSGSDCHFSNVQTTGGFYGFKGYDDGSGTQPGDSAFWQLNTKASYSDRVYLEGYNGMWNYRGKHDGSWPVQAPTSANVKGTYAPGTYAVGDVVESGTYSFQCKVAGTATAASLTAADFGTEIDAGGGCVFLTAMTGNRAALHISSDCFNNVFMNVDMSGGEYYGARLRNGSSTNAPQTVIFDDGCEFGAPLRDGLQGSAADDLRVLNTTVDSGVASTGIGLNLGTCRMVKAHNNTVRSFNVGVQFGSAADNVSVCDNHFADVDTCVFAGGNAKHFNVIGNFMGGDDIWGDNGVPYSLAAGTDYCNVAMNIINGATGSASDSNSGRTHGYVGNNW